MSKINDIKERTRKKVVTPAQAIIEDIGEEKKVGIKEEKNIGRNVGKIERKRVSFDIRVDLHKELKMQSLIREKNIYILIEEAIEKYLDK